MNTADKKLLTNIVLYFTHATERRKKFIQSTDQNINLQ